MPELPRITLPAALAAGLCYDAERIAKLYAGRESLTALDILTLDIPAEDRIWAVTQEGVCPDPILWTFACDCTERALPNYERVYPDDDRPRQAVNARRRWLIGKCSGEELRAAADAADAAYSAAADAAYSAAAASNSVYRAADSAADAACIAAYIAAYRAAYIAAYNSAYRAAYNTAARAAADAAYSAAANAAYKAAYRAARTWQVARLTAMLTAYVEQRQASSTENADA
jgi:hypothetical protein